MLVAHHKAFALLRQVSLWYTVRARKARVVVLLAALQQLTILELVLHAVSEVVESLEAH